MSAQARAKEARQVDLYVVAAQMRQAGLPDVFISGAVEVASRYRGARELMMMWHELEETSQERDEVVADLQEMLEAYQHPTGHKQERYVRFDDLESVAEDIMAFKNGLLQEVNKQCTLTELSERTGMPLPSLSRFFNTPSMPRRSTLLKIGEALNLSAVEVATQWDYE